MEKVSKACQNRQKTSKTIRKYYNRIKRKPQRCYRQNRTDKRTQTRRRQSGVNRCKRNVSIRLFIIYNKKTVKKILRHCSECQDLSQISNILKIYNCGFVNFELRKTSPLSSLLPLKVDIYLNILGGFRLNTQSVYQEKCNLLKGYYKIKPI